jgi:nucleotide-binding universal stress UspA family protein
MSQTNTSPARIVIVAAVDETAASANVAGVAAGLGRTLAGAELHVLHVVDAMPKDTSIVDAIFPNPTEVLEAGRALIERTIADTRGQFPGKIVGHLAAGKPWREIVQFATNVDADLIVVGTHDEGAFKRLVLGSVAESVAKHAPCAVLIARPKGGKAAAVPEIEPPCVDCVEVQRKTSGERLWCERHSAHRVHGRLHYESP